MLKAVEETFPGPILYNGNCMQGIGKENEVVSASNASATTTQDWLVTDCGGKIRMTPTSVLAVFLLPCLGE